MILTSILYLFLAILTYLAFKFILKPYLTYRKYINIPGFHGEFVPIYGVIRHLYEGIKQYKDGLGFYKTLPQKDQEARAHVQVVGDTVVLTLLDIKLIKQFYSKNDCYEKVIFQSIKQLGGTGLFSAEGKVWKQHRKLISNVFHYDFIQSKIPMIVDTTKEFLGEMPSSQIDLMTEIQKITGEVVGRIFFGENLNNYQMEGKLLTIHLADLMASLAVARFQPLNIMLQFLKIDANWLKSNMVISKKIAEFRAVCLKIIQDRKKSGVELDDLLGILLKTQTNENPEDRYTDEDIINEFVTFFIAGMDTTGHLVTMALYCLHRYPQFKGQIMKEIEEVYSQGSVPTSESIAKMDYTHQFLKETLRFYTPAPGPFGRVPTKEHFLDGIQIKKGMRIRPNPLYNGFHPQFFDDPYEFNPDRWVKGGPASKIDPFAFIPFSAGPRNCIGQHLSIIESKIILAEFLKKFEFKIPDEYELKMTVRFVYEPLDKITADLKLRASQ